MAFWESLDWAKLRYTTLHCIDINEQSNQLIYLKLLCYFCCLYSGLVRRRTGLDCVRVWRLVGQNMDLEEFRGLGGSGIIKYI